MITGSAFPRLFACPGSEALPQARLTSTAATDGTKRHADVEAIIKAGRLSELPDRIRALIPTGAMVASEVAFAWDPITGKARQLGVGLGRDYSGAKPHEIPCTTDILIVAGDYVCVIDLKGHEDVGAPDENEQVLFEAMTAARAYDVDGAVAAIAYIGPGLEDPFVSVRTLDALDLDAFAGRALRLLAEIEVQIAKVARGQQPDVNQSDACKYCPARAAGACPADAALLVRINTGEEAIALESLLADDATAAEALRRWRIAKKLVDTIGARLYARAAQRPIPVGEGVVFGRRVKPGDRAYDGKLVHAQVAERYGRHIADAAVTLKATQKQLTEALKLADIPPGKSVSKAKEEILDAVEEAGGMTRKESESYEEFPLALPSAKDTAA